MTDSTELGKSIAGLREDYRAGTLDPTEVSASPFEQFANWLSVARESREHDEPTAMTLATADANGVPSARTVLLKGFDERGFTWFTNYNSRKGRELSENPVASLVFRWAVQERQVVICGPVERVASSESDDYFHSRPRGSRIGAIVSAQSTVIENREQLEADAQRLAGAPDESLLRPAGWGGFRLLPISVEFWQGRTSRLHDRVRYRRNSLSDNWTIERLSP